MSPALIRRIEHKTILNVNNGRPLGPMECAYIQIKFCSENLDCFEMPSAGYDILGYVHYDKNNAFGWTGESYERWVSLTDKIYLSNYGFVLRYFSCPPGTVFIGNEQVIFNYKEATLVREEELV